MKSFKRGLNPMIFIGQLSEGDRGWCAYLFPQGVTYTKDTIELDQIFGEQYEHYVGSFLFSPNEVSLDSQEKADHFVKSIASYITSRHVSYRHLLWAEDFSNLASIYDIGFFNNNMTDATSWVLSPSLTLHWEEGCSLSYDAARKCLSIKGKDGLKSPMYIAKNNPDGKDGTHYPIREMWLFLDGGAKSCLELGCLEFDLVLSLNGDFDELDFGLRYFAYDKENKKICSQRYPLLSHASGNVGLKVRLDPTCCLNHERNFWAFDQASSPLPSSFITTTGHRILITPAIYDCASSSAPARMIFARKGITPGDDFYLVPQGDFTLAVQESPSKATTFSLLCGLKGTESIIFFPGNMLRFKADYPAYDSDFPKDPVSAPKIDAFLENLLTTSWITIIPGSSNSSSNDSLPVPRYSAQPEGAPLYTHPSNGFLGFYEAGKAIPSNPPKNPDVKDNFCFPMAPYSMLQIDPHSIFSPDRIGDFELGVLSPARKREIYGNSATTTIRALVRETNSITCATPQGFILKLESDGSYSEVCLAQTNGEPVSFTELHPELHNALQTNQLFLVVTEKAMLGELANAQSGADIHTSKFYNAISLSGWNFRVNVPEHGTPGDYRNVVIFKFCKGKLKDLAGRPDLWAKPEDFNAPGGLESISQWLVDFIAEAVGAAEGSSGEKEDILKNFAEIADNSNWNGVLFLRVDVDDFPEDIRAMLVGMDRSRLCAHHLGIEINHMAGDISMYGNSSIFGAILYNDPRTVQDTSPDYDFRVLDLKVLFEKSVIKSFESKCLLTINRIFDCPVLFTKTGGGIADSNGIILKGSVQKIGANIVYTLDTTDDCSVYLDNNILTKVEVVKAQMSRAQVPDKSGKATARFDLWGFLDFASLTYKVKETSAKATAKSRSLTLIPLDAALDRDPQCRRDIPITRQNSEQVGWKPCQLDVSATGDLNATVSKDLLEESGTLGSPSGSGRAISATVEPGAGETEATELFDIFSFGSDYLNEKGEISLKDEIGKGLYFSGLGITMTYDSGGSNLDKTFNPDLSRISFDLSKSSPRNGSLVKQFTLQLERLEQGDENFKPEGNGFLKVKTSSKGPKILGVGEKWYGLRFRLNMGTVGELAGKAGLVSDIRLAWSPESKKVGDCYNAFVGIKLPGSEGVEVFDLQGFMKLSIGGIRLGIFGNNRSFVMTLSSIALKLMGLLKIPPSGATSAYLFGSPKAEEKGLGWYAMYKKGS